ncbi:hypothetical protein MPH_13974 [Macrophomina phaseolina MS6]|uniref:non-specific serine/threonine protein kinase n=1 Tax=Macrophomina phaseolina (strain MS6) TaxID=1126212 RepID=K2RG58_MACPH|nr:hypothetical protein MPH_13974 [Macrophomina phaseolina MS6]
MAQLSESQLAIIRDHPIGDALNSCRDAFGPGFPRVDLRGAIRRFEQFVAEPSRCNVEFKWCKLINAARKNLVLRLIGTLQLHPAALNLLSDDGGLLGSALYHLYARLSTSKTDVKHTAQLVRDVVAGENDATIWTTVYDLIRQTQPAAPTITSTTSVPTTRPETPPPSAPSTIRSVKDTPWTIKSGSLISTTETRKEVDPLLKFEVEQNLIVDHPDVFDAYFGRVAQLSDITTAVFEACRLANPPMHTDGAGWTDWPPNCNQNEVLGFLRRRIDQFLSFAGDRGFQPSKRRRCVTAPDQPLDGSTSKRKLDVGVARSKSEDEEAPCHWSHILVPGELKSNPAEDNYHETRLDISRYAREVFAAQDTRRFVLGFTLCGSLMRLWEFDRLGVVASESFDINADGRRFVSVILGYLWMNEEELGFDPTIIEDDGGRYMEITRDDKTERIYIEEFMKRQRSLAGRATTCWKARVGSKSGNQLVIKDSWEDERRPEEGLLLKEATDAKAKNVARYYHHETVHVGDAVDDVRENIRKGLSDAGGRNPIRRQSTVSSVISSAITSAVISSNSGHGGGKDECVSRKRPPSSVEGSMPPPPPKRSRSDLTTRQDVPRRNRVHRRVIMRDIGKSLYEASSLRAMLIGLLGGVKGHQSLLKAGILHRDISIGNVLLNEAEKDGFLIDLDLGIKMDRNEGSGAPEKTGTLVFMDIGPLYGEDHEGRHGFGSCFWLLFWICIHWNGAGRTLSRSEYDSWNSKNTKELAREKMGLVIEQEKFNMEVKRNFTEYCQPLIPCIQELREVVFPEGKRRTYEHPDLYVQMKTVLEKTIRDLGT